MNYTIFLGCTIPSRQLNYEQSARAVTRALGIDLTEVDFGCCGFPIEPIDESKALSMAAMNLKKAQEVGHDVVALCSACGEMLLKAKSILEKDEYTKTNVNKILTQQLETSYENENPRIIHFARMLYEDIGIDNIKKFIKRPLKGLKIATHPGCHFVRPSTLFENFDDPEFPSSLDRLVDATGAQSVDYEGKIDCCGGGILAVKEGLAKSMTRKKLETLSQMGVDALVLICPFCGIMYDRYQKLMASEIEKEFNIPILYYPQLLGLALGINPEDLGFDVNSISIDGFIEKVGV